MLLKSPIAQNTENGTAIKSRKGKTNESKSASDQDPTKDILTSLSFTTDISAYHSDPTPYNNGSIHVGTNIGIGVGLSDQNFKQLAAPPKATLKPLEELPAIDLDQIKIPSGTITKVRAVSTLFDKLASHLDLIREKYNEFSKKVDCALKVTPDHEEMSQSESLYTSLRSYCSAGGTTLQELQNELGKGASRYVKKITGFINKALSETTYAYQCLENIALEAATKNNGISFDARMNVTDPSMIHENVTEHPWLSPTDWYSTESKSQTETDKKLHNSDLREIEPEILNRLAYAPVQKEKEVLKSQEEILENAQEKLLKAQEKCEKTTWIQKWFTPQGWRNAKELIKATNANHFAVQKYQEAVKNLENAYKHPLKQQAIFDKMEGAIWRRTESTPRILELCSVPLSKKDVDLTISTFDNKMQSLFNNNTLIFQNGITITEKDGSITISRSIQGDEPESIILKTTRPGRIEILADLKDQDDPIICGSLWYDDAFRLVERFFDRKKITLTKKPSVEDMIIKKIG